MLKAAVVGAAFVLFSACPAARADTLITGAIRAGDGSPVAAARVTGFDALGRVVGRDTALADGTFALSATSTPVAVTVACDYCTSVRRAVSVGEPVIVIVQRFSAVTASVPSQTDILALPYRRAAEIAGLVPFTVTAGDGIADRGLDFVGAVSLNGLPFYNPADGSTAAGLVPAHAVAALDALPALVAPVYGGYADAGLYDLRLHSVDLSTSRVDDGNAADVIARVDAPGGHLMYAASRDTTDERRALGADAMLPFVGGRLSVNALSLADSTAQASGVQLAYATQTRRFATAASLSATRTGDSSLICANVTVDRNGPFALRMGVRALRATAALAGLQGEQFDAALYAAGSRRIGVGTVAASVAWDHGSDSGIGTGAQSAALSASFSDDLQLNSHWSLHLGGVSDARVPTFGEVLGAAPVRVATDRNVLVEDAFRYSDLQRVRIAALVYEQQSSGTAFAGHRRGAGIDAAWQISPTIVMRAWMLYADRSAVVPSAPLLPAARPGTYAANDATALQTTGRLTWLTYEKWLRIDVLVRSGALAADVRVPLGSRYSLAFGSSAYQARRVTTVGLTLR